MKKFKTIFGAMILIGASLFFAGCNKKESPENQPEELSEDSSSTETESGDEEDGSGEQILVSWSESDLECYLTEASKWIIDNSDAYDCFGKDGSFMAGLIDKGESVFGEWKVVSPNTVEIIINAQIEDMVIKHISPSSFVWGNENHVSRCENLNFSESFINRILQFEEELTKNYGEYTKTSDNGDVYFYYDEPLGKIVKTDDGSNVNYRGEPIIGEVMGKFADGTPIVISKRTKELYIIEDKSDYWYYGLCYADIEPYGGWVYGGYLIDDENYENEFKIDDEESLDEDADSSVDVKITNSNSRFFENGKIVDTMYVDATDGLKVRNSPNLNSNKLCGISYRLPVKIVAVGKDETINNVTAPWVEILIPRYEWKGDKPEYGWVFGGYLSKEIPAYAEPKNAQEFKQYLESSYWLLTFENGGDAVINLGCFENNNVYTYAEPYDINRKQIFTSFEAVGKNSFSSRGASFSDAGSEVEQYLFVPGTTQLDFVDEDSMYISMTSYPEKLYAWEFRGSRIFPGKVNNGLGNIIDLNYTLKDKQIYAIIGGKNILQKYIEEKIDTKETVNQFIEIGISAKGTEYETQYHDYWDPIMKAHQKKVNAMN